jgi:hypothetical protein
LQTGRREIMAGNNAKKEKAGTEGLTFTVAECGEFHSLGECHEGIRIHKAGEPESEDLVLDLVSGRAINTGLIRYVPEADSNPFVWEAVRELIKIFPEKEVFD